MAVQQLAFRAQVRKGTDLIRALLGADPTNVDTVVNHVFLRNFPGIGIPDRMETIWVLPNAFVAGPAVQHPLVLGPIRRGPELAPDFSEVLLADIADDARVLEALPGPGQQMAVLLGRGLVPLHEVAFAALHVIVLPGFGPGFLPNHAPVLAFSAFTTISEIYGA